MRRLTPTYRPLSGTTAPGDPVDRIARRLVTTFAGEPVRTLEAIAAAEVNRIAARGAGAPVPGDGTAELPGGHGQSALDRQCRRIVRRAVAGSLDTPAAGAVAYHRDTAQPHWARGRRVVAELGGFVFLGPASVP
jgi:hypothetical protein